MASKFDKKLVVCLGAHRSGTSMLTASIAALGADAKIDETYANPENQKGFFEHPRLIVLNDILLERLGSTWDAPCFDYATSAANVDLVDIFQDAVEFISTTFHDVPLALIKDPRVCMVLPFWVRVFEHCGYAQGSVKYIHILRSPYEAAVSQFLRSQNNPIFYEFGKDIREGAILWRTYIQTSFAQYDEQNTQLVWHKDLLRSPLKVGNQVAKFLDVNSDDFAEFANEFFDPQMYRSTVSPEQKAEIDAVLPQAGELFERFLKLYGTDRPKQKQIDDVFANVGAVDGADLLGPILLPALQRISLRWRNEYRRTLYLDQLVQGKSAELDKANDAEKNIVELKQKVESLTRDNRLLTNELVTFKSTITFRSWNAITKMTTRRLTKSANVARLNEIGRWGYRAVKSISPKAANSLRGTLEPHLRKINRGTWNTDVPPLASQIANQEKLFKFDFQLPKAVNEEEPLVTIIVPNFNHADYLVERLESIYAQTYKNFEVILMDDCSSDASREILQGFANRYPENTRVVFNEQNSGGVFFQWRKGIAMARGSLIWMAESDDWCSENFLETLIPFFGNPAVQISYAKTDFMNGAGDIKIWSMEEYLQDLGPDRWGHSFVETAPDIVKSAFGVKNIIPNASSAVFRTFEALDALGAADWTKMKTCGDWLFYLNVIRGGMIAYSPDARNYYRIHDTNTSVTSYSKDSFYQEHETIARFINRTYTVDPAIFAHQEQNLITHWKQNRKTYAKAAFEKTYDLKGILKESENRKPNLLMAGFAFCAGGGETFPIQLANLMKDYGYNVTFLDCGREEEVPEIRKMLRADIPVVSNFSNLSHIVERFDIGIIHSHNAWVDNAILDVLPDDTPARTVVSLHGMYETIDAEYRKTILPRLSSSRPV